jgi:hypothetical protein
MYRQYYNGLRKSPDYTTLQFIQDQYTIHDMSISPIMLAMMHLDLDNSLDVTKVRSTRNRIGIADAIADIQITGTYAHIIFDDRLRITLQRQNNIFTLQEATYDNPLFICYFNNAVINTDGEISYTAISIKSAHRLQIIQQMTPNDRLGINVPLEFID